METKRNVMNNTKNTSQINIVAYLKTIKLVPIQGNVVTLLASIFNHIHMFIS